MCHAQGLCGWSSQYWQFLDGDCGLQFPRPKWPGGVQQKYLTIPFLIFFANFQVGQLPLQAGDDAGAIQWMPLDAKVVVVTQMKFNFRDVPNFQLLSFNFPGDPVRQPQRFCWEGRWKVRSPLVNGGLISWYEQFRLHDYDKLKIKIVGSSLGCRPGM